MTPKEKAQELVDKFLLEITGVDKYSYNIDSMNLFSAKQCALIAVDEILNALSYKASSNFEELKYFVEVKQEIEKI
jgi:hypothetical protein